MNHKTQKIRVLILARSFDHLGGIVNYCQMLMRNIKRDITIDHFVSGTGYEINNIPRKIASFVRDIFCLMAKLRREKYDIVHLNPSMLPIPLVRDFFFLIVFVLFGYNQRVMTFIHGWDEKTAITISQNAFLRKLVVRILEISRQVVVLSHNFQKVLLNMGLDENRVAVTTTMYEKPGHGRAIATNDRPVTVLFMARFVAEKGLFVAGRIAKRLKDNGHENLRFIFAGDGPERLAFERFVSENGLEGTCELIGYVRGADKNRILARSHIMLFPTFYAEGCPIVLLEAMGSGLAIVSTRVGAIPEVITNGVNGYLHDTINEELFIESILRLANDKKLLSDIMKTNVLNAEKHYEASIVSEQIRQFYLSML